MTTAITRPRVLHPVATRPTDQSDTEPSGAQWAQRFKGSKDTKDLACTFRKAVDAFVEAMTKAGIQAFDMNALNTAPALRSLHNEGQAIDMSISWTGTVRVKDGNGKLIEVKTLPRSGMNSQLKAIGASYGVKKFVGGARDKPHWSINGR